MVPRDISTEDAIAYWCGPSHETFVAEEGARILGVVGTLPEAFHHPTLGYVDALVMYRRL